MYLIFPLPFAHPGIAYFFQILKPFRPVLAPATLQFGPDADPMDDPSHDGEALDPSRRNA